MSLEYTIERTDCPPTLRERDGQWFVCIHLPGGRTIEAPAGRWFASQVIDKLVLPKLDNGR